MSWSINAEGTKVEVMKATDDTYGVPKGIKEYVGAGIDALVKRYGEDVKISINGSGHLFTGEEGNHDQTTAHLTVKKAE